MSLPIDTIAVQSRKNGKIVRDSRALACDVCYFNLWKIFKNTATVPPLFLA